MSNSERVKKCVEILNTLESDSKKFAALFMVTKLILSENCSSMEKKMLFEAIGSEFLQKLLVCAPPEGCEPDACKCVAISILSGFVTDPELSVHPEMLIHVPKLLECISNDDNSTQDSKFALKDAYTYLQSIVQFPPGQSALIQHNAFEKLSETYLKTRLQCDKTLGVLTHLVIHQMEAWNTANPALLHKILDKLASDFESDHSARKFTLCSYIHTLLSFSSQIAVASSWREHSWPQNLLRGLSDILSSRIGGDQRNPALKLASTALYSLGIDWAMSGAKKSKRFFHLLVQLASVEVRMQLEDKQLDGIVPNAELITACFAILEVALSSANQIDQDSDRQALNTALDGAFLAVLGLLTSLSVRKLSGVEERAFICAMVRVLAAWLAEETSALRPEVYAVLPFLLAISNDSFYIHRNRNLSEKTKVAAAFGEGSSSGCPVVHDLLSEVDILRVMLPALCHLAIEQEPRKILQLQKQEQVLFECFEYHWAIFHWPTRNSSSLADEKDDSKTAMISLCSIFMNITVLDVQYVDNCLAFRAMLDFILKNLTRLSRDRDNIILHGHLAVLGLMLLRLRREKYDLEVCKYITDTVQFFADAYGPDRGDWEDISELWFLGMQIMASAVQDIPWLVQFAGQSGWALGIVEVLGKIKAGQLPARVKLAYENLLCRLVRVDADTAQCLRNSKLIAVCREHRMMELAKWLVGE